METGLDDDDYSSCTGPLLLYSSAPITAIISTDYLMMNTNPYY